MRRIGIFGGTFDPIHLGHLVLAEQCRDQARLDEVWFVPAGVPPHKRHRSRTEFEQRAEMIALAIAGHPAFRIDEIEKDGAVNYTADTLAELRRRHPDDELLLLIGSDSWADLPKWYQPARIVEAASLIVWGRPNYPVKPADAVRTALNLPPGVELRHQVVSGALIDVSSTELREWVATGRSIRYLVPRAVECYIQEKGLYDKTDLSTPWTPRCDDDRGSCPT